MKALWRLGWPYGLGLLGGALGTLLVILLRGVSSEAAAGWAAAIGTFALAIAAIGTPLWQAQQTQQAQADKLQQMRATVGLALSSTLRQLLEVRGKLEQGASWETVGRETAKLDRHLDRLRGLYLHCLDIPEIAEVIQVFENILDDLLVHREIAALGSPGEKERAELSVAILQTCTILAAEMKSRGMALAPDVRTKLPNLG